MSGKTELKIFDDHPPQVVVEAGYFEDIHPQTSLDSESVIEFNIHGSNVDYLDLNDTLLSLQVKIVKKDNTSLVATDLQPVASNYFMHTLFSDVSLSLNDVVIEGGASLYPYKAAIESQLNFDHLARDTQLYALGCSTDSEQRLAWTRESRTCELVGALRLDFLNQPKYLIPGVNVRLKLTRSTADFALSYKLGDKEPTDGSWKIIFQKAILYVRRVKVHPAVIKAHTFGLQTKNALYPYTRSKVISFAIPQGSTSYFHDNLFSSVLLPKVVIIGLVKGSAFTGTLKHRPLEFHDFELANINLLRDGQSLPYRSGYTCDFKGSKYTDVYVRSIIQNMNLLNTNNSCNITLNDFKKEGSAFFIFNLTPDFDLRERQIAKDSNLRLDLTFKVALTESINVVAYATYDATLQITNDREIVRDGFI